ncbi:hypothetical protein L8C07_05445 [Paenibacillus sp. CMAA1739]|uniref:hypothetical protein n=1 Tax=Paenibacillus ottowii TaxID=2315729 RepID=UPI002DB73BB6|nr:hypothetical protein [Paenibacillus sp. CMAA1739]MEC4565382.1 hypothetical protein [Paenibacillus sp. CMAA1739]
MKPIDLYNRTFESKHNTLGQLKGFYYDHLPEIEDDFWGIKEEQNKKVTIREYKNFDFDGRRYWLLASVWFENDPVMIIQNAGREGDDHRRRFITDKEKYKEMIKYIHTLLETDSEVADCYDPNDDIPDLDSFYGHTLDGTFKRHY